MEKIISINVSDINDEGFCNLLVTQKIYAEGELLARKNWRCVLAKDTDLALPIQTTFGPICIATEFVPEADFIHAKWKDMEAV